MTGRCVYTGITTYTVNNALCWTVTATMSPGDRNFSAPL